MLSENGYERPTYDEILSGIVSSMQDRFGADINVSPTSTFGVMARFLASIYNEQEQKMEQVYNNAFISKAAGVSLDRIAGNYGVQRNQSTYAIVDLIFKGTANYVVQANTSYSTSDGYIFALSSNVTLDANGNGVGIAYAIKVGAAYNVSPNTIVNQVQPVSDVISVTNLEGADGGADLETDAQLRARLLFAVKGINSATYNGVQSQIQAVSGVQAVRIVQNTTGNTDSYGNPPYTIHIYVQGGSDKGIANAIFTSMAFGINTYGSIVVSVLDNAGASHNVMFDRATNKPIFVQVNITKNDSFPVDGIDQVKAQIKTYINSLTMGQTVRFSYMYKYIYDTVVGIEVADIKIGTSASNLAVSDITLKPFEVAGFNADDVTVNVSE